MYHRICMAWLFMIIDHNFHAMVVVIIYEILVFMDVHTYFLHDPYQQGQFARTSHYEASPPPVVMPSQGKKSQIKYPKSKSKIPKSRGHEESTGWSLKTVDCNIFLTSPKISKSAKTQWLLESSYREVLVFWCFKTVRCVKICLLKLFQYRVFATQYKAWALPYTLIRI